MWPSPTSRLGTGGSLYPCEVSNLVHDFMNFNALKTRPTHRRTDANLYPPERQLTKASEPSFDLEGGAKGQIRHHTIPSPQNPASWFHFANL